MAKIEAEFTKRNTKLIGLSVYRSDAGCALARSTSRGTEGAKVNYLIIATKTSVVSKFYSMPPAEEEMLQG